VISFALGALAGHYWPARFVVVNLNGATLRLDRDGGAAAVLDADSGWRPIPGPPPPFRARPNPFDSIRVGAHFRPAP
jgi:hypothetical protein